MQPPDSTRASATALQDTLSYLLAAAIGLWAALNVFPVRDLLGRLPPGVPSGADQLQHVAGELYFLAEPWHWPLFEVHGLDAPHGVNIALTDSIPLAAVVLKLLHPWLPGVREAVGPWLGLAWLMQPVAAVYALRGTGERGVAASLAVAVMAAAMPTFLLRVGHAALDGHFILLGALGLYLRATRPGAHAAPIAMLSLLVVLTLFVHPYLMAMSAAIAVAVPATLAARALWRRATLAALPVLAALVVTAESAKLFGYTSGRAPGDYGLFVMNLAAPFWPALSRLAPHAAAQATDATGGQLFEGYQYLGAGLLGLLFVLMATRHGRSWIVSSRRRHAGLLWVCVALTAYAVSTQVTLFRHVLLRLPVVPPGGYVFRASGRLFWPVAYVLLLAAVRGTAVMGSRVRAPLLLFAAGLQLFDSSGLRIVVHDRRFFDDQREDATDAALDAILVRTRSVAMEPRIECDGSGNWLAMPVVYLAARRVLPVNTMYSARVEDANRCDPARDPAVANLAPGALGVTYGRRRAAQAVSWRRHGLTCADLASLTLCSRDAGLLVALTPTPPGAPLPSGETVTAVRRQLFADSLASGWGPVESWGAWAVEPVPTLHLHVPPMAGAVRVTLGLQAPPGVTTRPIDVRQGGRVVATAAVDQQNRAVSFVLPPGAATEADAAAMIVLTLDAGPTVTIPGVPRRFDIGLVSVQVSAAEPR